MPTTSHQISDKLYLTRLGLPKTSGEILVPQDTPVNHVVVIDCSGSMWNDLPKIREQLKKRVPKLLREKDTLSIIWFSGRGQFGTLLEAEPVATLTELQEVNNAIDRYLRPVCLTGFKEPLEEVVRVVARVGSKNQNPFAMIFMSDGWDNQWSKTEVLQAVGKTVGGLSSATFVEYGNYADRVTLTKMAEKAGGSLIFAADFDQYAPIFESAVSKKVSGAPRAEMSIPGDVIGGFAFAVGDKELVTYEVEGGKTLVPVDLGALWCLTPNPIGAVETQVVDETKHQHKSGAQNLIAATYAAASLFSVRMQPKVVLPLLAALGDVRFIKKFGGCFGKQAYSDFMEATQTAALEPDKRWEEGFDPKAVPSDDAFTVLDFLRVLNSDDANRVLLDSKDFKYNVIGRVREDVTEVEDEKGVVTKITPLKFVVDDAPNGYSVSNLTFNESRPNVSILVRKEGVVDLTKRMKETGWTAGRKRSKVPRKFPSSIFRNYAIIRDGIVNVDRLPVRMTGGTVRQLVKEGFPMDAVLGIEGEDCQKAITRLKKASDDRPVSFVVNLRALPVINRNMVKDQSAQELFEAQYELMEARGRQKVLNGLQKEKYPRESVGFKALYEEDGAAWLKEQGITDYSGFGPKTKTADASDFYIGKELKISLKGISSLPSFNDARKKIAAGKGVTARYELLVPAFNEVADFENSDFYRTAKTPDKIYQAWLDDQLGDAKKVVRDLLHKTSQIRFGIIVGQTWFTEFGSLDENTLTISPGGRAIQASVELRELEVKI